MMIDTLTYAGFAALQGERFEVRLGAGQTLALTLATATQAPPPTPASPLGERFSLIFVGPRSPFLAQGTYEFSHPALGSFPLFIVPVGAEADQAQYEAVFNRLKRPEAATS
jgi:hypothetical protein